MRELLLWLSGKKSVIATILMAIAGYCSTKGYLDLDLFGLITVLIGTIFGVASYQTGKIYREIDEE
jgi:type IV secretory pathway VirB2 component (pilin)